MATNFEELASSPEKVADLILQFNPMANVHLRSRPAFRSYQRFVEESQSSGCMRMSVRDWLVDWLKEEGR